MTANFRTIDLETPAPPAQRAQVRASMLTWPDRVVFPLLVVALLGMYLMLQNPYWVPAGDSELYTAAARNMASGDGYTFSGKPIALIPPGWSWMMALVMRVSPYFLPLKLMTMSCMIASLLCGYWIARRFVSPVQSAGVILLTAVLSHMYQATYWLISESAFCLATSASILVAMQIAEGKKQWWRVVLMLLLCAAAVTIRWAGFANMIIVVAVLLDRQWRPRLRTEWVAAGLAVLIIAATFFGWREGLRGTPEEMAAAADVVTGTGEEMAVTPMVTETAPISGTADQAARTYQLFPTGSYADRLLNWGRWFSYLYWQPFRAAGASVKIAAASTVLGWVIIGLLGVLVCRSVLERRWLWPATGAYCAALALGWTNVNARYYVPIAFLITLGMFLTTDLLLTWRRSVAWRRVVLGAFFFFVASVALCNGALYAVEATIARSSRFYQRYETGLNVALISACQHLRSLPVAPGDGEVAVSARYTNLNKTKPSPFGPRAAELLLDRRVVTPRFSDTAAAPTATSKKARTFRAWLQSKGVKYYLYQPEISPWRVWHFRMGWYEKMQTGRTAAGDTAGWQLYRVDNDKLTPVGIPRRCAPVTRVPGL